MENGNVNWKQNPIRRWMLKSQDPKLEPPTKKEKYLCLIDTIRIVTIPNTFYSKSSIFEV